MTEEARCVICGASGELHRHHLAGREAMPSVEVPVCETRHAAWHRSLRAGGVRLGSPEACEELGRLRVLAVSMRVLLEDGAALYGDPAWVRALVRARAELALRLIAAAQAEGNLAPTAAAPAPRSLAAGVARGEREHDCRARAPCSSRERRARLAAFLAGTLPALAALLEEILPAELGRLQAPQRLRKLDTLALSETWPEALERAAERSSEILVELEAGRIPPVERLGAALDALVAQLERGALR